MYTPIHVRMYIVTYVHTYTYTGIHTHTRINTHTLARAIAHTQSINNTVATSKNNRSLEEELSFAKQCCRLLLGDVRCGISLDRCSEEQTGVRHRPEDDICRVDERASGGHPQGQQQVGVHHGLHTSTRQCQSDGGFSHALSHCGHPRRSDGHTQRLAVYVAVWFINLYSLSTLTETQVTQPFIQKNP